MNEQFVEIMNGQLMAIMAAILLAKKGTEALPMDVTIAVTIANDIIREVRGDSDAR